MEASTSFAARRPAATALPAFALPPPDIPSMQRHPGSTSYPPTSVSQSYAAAAAAAAQQALLPTIPSSSTSTSQPVPSVPPASNILTPPPGAATEGLSPLSSGVNSGSSQSSQPGAGQYYSHLGGQWPTPGGHSGSYAFGGASASQNHQGGLVQPYGASRSLYSTQYAPRTTASPASADNLPPPPYTHDVPTFQTPLSGNGGAAPHSAAAALASQGQPPVLSSQSLGSQPPTPSTAPPTTDSYRGPAAPPTPTGYYAPSSTPQQSSFPSYAPPQQSPTHPSPTTSANAGGRGVPPVPGQGSAMAAPNIGYGGPRPQAAPAGYAYQLPNVGNGPVMSNLGAPGGQMALVPGMGLSGGYVGGGHPHMPHHHLYGHNSHAPQQDRPFKCDQCPQSFNRNHDLKRHKRIHLAVKPFPCNFCDKSFSRKDALKRHRLVKGCGEKAKDGGEVNGVQDESPTHSEEQAAEEPPKQANGTA